MPDNRSIDEWLSAYEEAWSTDQGVSDLFTPDARYYTAPYRPAIVGVEAIESWWLGQGEAQSAWVFEREVIAREGRLHVVRGTTTYTDTPGADGGPRVYYNLWLVTLEADGRASEFAEYWMLRE